MNRADNRKGVYPHLSSDGRVLVEVRKDGEGFRLELWDATTGRFLNRFPAGPPVLAPNQWHLQQTFSVDGNQLAAWAFDGTDPERSSGRLRIWDVNTGQELSAPDSVSYAMFASPSGMMLGVTSAQRPAECGGWNRPPSTPIFGLGMPLSRTTDGKLKPVPAPDSIARHWDRASGRVTSHRFRPGNGETVLQPLPAGQGRSADGRIVMFARSNRLGPSEFSERGPVECWDVAAEPPRRLWSVLATSTVHVSPGGKMVAISDNDGATVYRAEGRDGEPVVEWKADRLPAEAADSSYFGAVADDGRLAFSRSHGVAVLSPTRVVMAGPPGPTAATRRTLLYHPFGTDSTVVWFAPDGNTVVRTDPAGDVWTWQTARPSEPVIGLRPDGPGGARPPRGPAAPGTWRRLGQSPDGRLSVFASGQHFSESSEVIVTDSVTGEPRHRIAMPEGATYPEADFVAGGQRLLVQYRTGVQPATWFRVSDESHVSPELGTVRHRKTGSRLAHGEPHGSDDQRPIRTVCRRGSARCPAGGGSSKAEPKARRTGRARAAHGGAWDVRVARARGHPHRGGPVQPLGRSRRGDNRSGTSGLRAARAASPLNQRSPASGPFDLVMLDTESGRLHWKHTGVDQLMTPEGNVIRFNPLFQLLFDPNGRLLVQYRSAPGEYRVWVGKADGTYERTLVIPAGSARSAAPGTMAHEVRRMTLDRDERRIALIGDREVRVWELESGAPVATLRGHATSVTAVELTPDGSRLFALYSPELSGGPFGVHLGVWDLATGRFVLAIRPPPTGADESTGRTGGHPAARRVS